MHKPTQFDPLGQSSPSAEQATFQTRQTAEYIEELLGELETLANGDGLHRLRVLLQQARKEARGVAFDH